MLPSAGPHCVICPIHHFSNPYHIKWTDRSPIICHSSEAVISPIDTISSDLIIYDICIMSTELIISRIRTISSESIISPTDTISRELIIFRIRTVSSELIISTTGIISREVASGLARHRYLTVPRFDTHRQHSFWKSAVSSFEQTDVKDFCSGRESQDTDMQYRTYLEIWEAFQIWSGHRSWRGWSTRQANKAPGAKMEWGSTGSCFLVSKCRQVV